MLRNRSGQARFALTCAVLSAAFTTMAAPALAGHLFRVDIKSDNVNSAGITPNGGAASSGYGFPPEGGTLGANTDSTIGAQSTPAFEAWLIDGGQVIDAGTGEVTSDPRLNRYDYTGVTNPNLHAYIQANAGELINSASQFGMVPGATASTPYYFNEVYRDYAIVSPPRLDPNATPTMTLNVNDSVGSTLLPNTAYNVTVFSYVKPYDSTGNNETTVNNGVYGNNTLHVTDATAGGLGSNTDQYQFVRPAVYPNPTNLPNSNPDTPLGNVLDNYTWASTITVFTDANSQLMLNLTTSREQSIGTDPQRFQLDYPTLSGFEVNNDVVRYVGPSGGNYSTAANWAPGPNNAAAAAPNAMSAIANFFTNGNNTVSLDTNVTIGNLNFNSAAGTGTTITNAGTNTITLDSYKGPNASAAISSRAGTHLVNAAVILKDRMSASVNSGSSVIFTGDLTTATTLVTERTGNTQIQANLVLRMDKIGGGVLGFRSISGVPQVRVFGGTLQTSGGVSKVNALSVSAGARLDLTGGAWAIDYTAGNSPAATIDALITSGRAGNFTGTGITSSKAAADARYTIGSAEASALGVTSVPGFASVPVDADTFLFRLTLLGDATLNGIVDFQDLVILAQNYNLTGRTFIQGDTNYSGSVDFQDLVALAQNYNLSAVGDSLVAVGDSSDFAGDWALAQSLVPEPTSLCALGALAVAGVRRKR
jgi:hypothetical protein